MLRKLFYILATASVLVGCNAALIEDAGEVGWLMIGFSGGEDDTKAGTADYSGYIVTMTGPSQYTLESTFGELPSVLELKPGDYTITVSTPGEASAAFDTPIYSSSKDFTIVTGETCSVTLLLTNVAVTLLHSDTFNRSTVVSCQATVSYAGHELVWTLDDIMNGRTGYFIGSAPTIHIDLEGQAANGKKLEYHEVVQDIEAPVDLKVTLGKWVPEI